MWPLKTHAPKHIPASTCKERKRKHAKETEKEKDMSQRKVKLQDSPKLFKSVDMLTHTHTEHNVFF